MLIIHLVVIRYRNVSSCVKVYVCEEGKVVVRCVWCVCVKVCVCERVYVLGSTLGSSEAGEM